MIIGFSAQKKYFSRLLKAGELSHAYLFSGPEAIGKKSFALEIATDNDHNHYDTKLIAPDQEKALGTISIDQVRDLSAFLATTPVFGKHKLVIVDDAHRLTEEAANALLKSIEEPNSAVVWMLVTHQADAMPLTIRSRCQEVRFLPQGDTVVSKLPEIEKLSTKDRQIILAIAQGRVGAALLAVADERLESMREAVEQWEKLPSLSVLDRLAYAKTLTQKEELGEVAGWWLAWIRTHLPQMPGRSRSARRLLALLPTLQQSQFNHRLAMENFLLGL